MKKNTDHFVTDLDSFGGNSGSPVYHDKTGDLVGILNRGELDFERKGDCYVSKKCKGGECNGEAVSYIDKMIGAIEQYKKLGYADPVTDEKDQPIIYSSFIPSDIPDANYLGVATTIRVDKEMQGKDLYVGVDIRHEWVGDLRLELINPDGDQMILQNLRSSEESGVTGVYGYDLVSDFPLQNLKNQNKKGIWTLKVIDSKSGDIGLIKNWRLIFH